MAAGEGWANALRRAPVAAVTTMSSPASEPKPISPAVPVTPRPKGMRAPIKDTWPRAIFTVPCSSRKPSAAMAVARWMPWQMIRWRVERNSRSVASRPQATAALSDTSDRTPVVKSKVARKLSLPATASRGTKTRAVTVRPPCTGRLIPGLMLGDTRILR
ncbi:hypothetical protein SCYAM73S_08577 [Streptomyces cyaneofuscatus]